jgi:hypothetical protein
MVSNDIPWAFRAFLLDADWGTWWLYRVEGHEGFFRLVSLVSHGFVGYGPVMEVYDPCSRSFYRAILITNIDKLYEQYTETMKIIEEREQARMRSILRDDRE